MALKLSAYDGALFNDTVVRHFVASSVLAFDRILNKYHRISAIQANASMLADGLGVQPAGENPYYDYVGEGATPIIVTGPTGLGTLVATITLSGGPALRAGTARLTVALLPSTIKNGTEVVVTGGMTAAALATALAATVAASMGAGLSAAAAGGVITITATTPYTQITGVNLITDGNG